MTDEKILVRQILAGDEAAFTVLVQKYQNLVYHIILRLVPDARDQEDLFQEVFLKVYRGLNNFRGESKLSTWIGRITFNTCMKFLKRQPPEADPEKLENIRIPAGEGVWVALEEKERKKQIQRAVQELPDIYRLLIELFHFRHLSYREIGEITQLPEGTVKNYLFRARKALKDILVKEKYREALF